MKPAERAALEALRFDWAPTHEDVWAPMAAHVRELNELAAAAIAAGLDEAARNRRRSPLGIPLIGQHGAGKTHMLSWAREQVQQRDGYFILVDLEKAPDFWQSVVLSMLDGLTRAARPGEDQLSLLLHRLCVQTGTDAAVRERIAGREPLTSEALRQFIRDLRRMDNRIGGQCQDTARALVLYRSQDPDAQDVGEMFMTAGEGGASADWNRWGLRRLGKSSHKIATEMSLLMSLTGPTLMAVDQIDTLTADMDASYDDEGDVTVEQGRRLEQVGNGLMSLRQTMPGTLTVVACMIRTWRLFKRNTTEAAADRFRPEHSLGQIPSPEIGRALVEAWFRPQFKGIGFDPPHPTWPVPPDAFSDAPLFSPRGLLKAVSGYIDACLAADELLKLVTLSRGAEPPESFESLESPGSPEPPAPEPVNTEGFAELDASFASLRLAADLGAAFEKEHEDKTMSRLLAAGLNAWRIEQGPAGAEYWVEPDSAERGSFHARLHRSLNEATEDEVRWAFRAIAAANSIAAQARLNKIRGMVGSGADAEKRKAFVVRRGAWPGGTRMTKAAAEFMQAGGVVLDADPADLAVYDALDTMMREQNPALNAWLVSRRPAGRTGLLTAVFGAPPPGRADPEDPAPGPAADTLPIGTRADRGGPVRVSLESLRKHTAIFAGSGSGKTVLIRRIVEECALLGVSSIVLDPNNDLARLGDPWPEPPRGWGPGDAAKAAGYLDGTDVVVWTPRREAGRPLALQPLPDFAAVRDDPDEFALALDSAVATLAPRARMSGETAKAERGRAVLREALDHLGRRGDATLPALTDLLAELPEGISSLVKAPEIAADLAQTLRAAMINDPLFGGSGVPLDPETLFTPPPGKRARISVISFVGLSTNEQRQSFVNQLQMALFAWIKQHPAGDRPLGGLYVMDEAQTLAPSGAMTACTGSTLALASQARKYGLGLVFATQAPRGIHNRIVGNAAAQFFGFLNSPVQIAAAKEMAAAKASDGVVDISRLTAGQFYAVGEGLPFQKIVAPMCLSHHPASALSTEEVLARARGGA